MPNASEPAPTKIWRYIDLAKFIDLLATKALYFAPPASFDDPYEGYMPRSHMAAIEEMHDNYIAQMRTTRDQLLIRRPNIDVEAMDKIIEAATVQLKGAYKDVNTRFGVSCWHESAYESDAMWKLYASRGSGIAIESTTAYFRQSIANPTLVTGRVRYMDFDNDPIEKGHAHYGLFLKRHSFDYEKEFRGTILLDIHTKGQAVSCDLAALVQRVHVAPFAPAYFERAVRHVVATADGMQNVEVIRSPLSSEPDY